jgi:hypothetical protein
MLNCLLAATLNNLVKVKSLPGVVMIGVWGATVKLIGNSAIS